MLFTETTFIGIDPTAGKRPMAYAALDQDLRLLALGDGDTEKITAYVGGQQGAYIAINAPRRPNQGLMEQPEIRESLSTIPRPGRWEGFRVAEYQLRLRNIRTTRTCRSEENCPGWIQNGFEIYRRLESMGCRDYPSTDAASQILEVYPHAAYSALLGNVPFTKSSLEGRLQRQLILLNKGLDIPDPMRVFEEITRYRILQGVLPLDGLYAAPQLDALVAAFTAWMAATHPGEITVLGHPQEGQIVLPVAELRSKY